ncbi:MMPL family transporter [Nakamurella sp.]|uniref:MMPL family transporter n=1 Tax=Nakamurella sp. TaxID=1869182 RepID=UPI003B3B2B4A
MARLLYRLGTFAHRRRWAVVLTWLVILALGVVGALSLAGTTSNTFSIPGQESTIALDKINREFGAGGTNATARVVIQAPAGQTLTSDGNAAAVTGLVTELGGLPGVVAAGNPLDPQAPGVNADQSTGYSTVTYGVPQGEVTTAEQDALLAAVAGARANGLTVEVTGTAVTNQPEVPAGVGEAIGVVLALLILALTYGSLVVAGMNLLTAGVGVGIGVLGITIVSGFVDLQSTTSSLATMLGLAVGIDYALFIITRYRHELQRGADVPTAVGVAVGTAGSAVVTAGLTVVIALVFLFVAGIPFLTQMGIAAAATVVVAVLVALTLVPAILSFLGLRALPRRRRADPTAPAAGRHAAPAPGFLERWVGTVTRHRIVALVGTVVALGVLAIPFFSMQTTLVQTPADGTTQARAEQLLADGFGPGFNGPLTILFEAAPGSTDAAARAAAAAGPISGLTDVALVTPPIPNPSGTAALLTVIPQSGPTSAATEQLVHDLRELLPTAAGGAQTSVTGATAVSVDVATALNDTLPIYLTIVVGLAVILLVLVFRSILVPLVGVLGFLLTVGAALGATVAVFQWGWLSGLVNLDSAGPLISLTPIIVIGILFGLAMDYQVFLVSRMHEAHAHGAGFLDAVRTGFRQAAPVVVAAAAIMFSVFAGFVPAGDGPIKSIAFALAVGILVDAFVVRMVLVPAALTLLGERAWWLPSWLSWLPTLDVEGAGLERAGVAGPDSPPAAPELVEAGAR